MTQTINMCFSRAYLGAAAALIVGGCAAPGEGATASLDAPVAGSYAAVGGKSAGYVLSAEELEFSCKQLTGRMQVRILEIRDYNERQQASGLSQVIRSASADLTGKTAPAALQRDLAMLEAYNAQLATKGCKTYDLADELRPKDFRETPTAKKK